MNYDVQVFVLPLLINLWIKIVYLFKALIFKYLNNWSVKMIFVFHVGFWYFWYISLVTILSVTSFGKSVTLPASPLPHLLPVTTTRGVVDGRQATQWSLHPRTFGLTLPPTVGNFEGSIAHCTVRCSSLYKPMRCLLGYILQISCKICPAEEPAMSVHSCYIHAADAKPGYAHLITQLQQRYICAGHALGFPRLTLWPSEDTRTEALKAPIRPIDIPAVIREILANFIFVGTAYQCSLSIL